MMNTYARPVRDLKNNYNEIINLANEGNQVIITQNGREAAVVIGIKAFKEYEDFLHRNIIRKEPGKTEDEAKDNTANRLSKDDFWGNVEDA